MPYIRYRLTEGQFLCIFISEVQLSIYLIFTSVYLICVSTIKYRAVIHFLQICQINGRLDKRLMMKSHCIKDNDSQTYDQCYQNYTNNCSDKPCFSFIRHYYHMILHNPKRGVLRLLFRIFTKVNLIPVDSLKELSKALTSLISFVIIIILYIFIFYN